MNHYALAKNNGKTGEDIVIDFLNEKYQIVKKLNDLLDIKVNHRYIEVKTCQEWITDYSHNNKKRHGRFYFFKNQHEELIRNGGVYAFVVLLENNKNIFFFCDAELIKIKFSGKNRNISWIKIMEMVI